MKSTRLLTTVFSLTMCLISRVFYTLHEFYKIVIINKVICLLANYDDDDTSFKFSLAYQTV